MSVYSPSGKSGLFVYVANWDSREIVVYRFDRTSGEMEVAQRMGLSGETNTAGLQLQALPDVPATEPRGMALAVSPDRRYLYATVRSHPYGIATFSIDPMTGCLAYVSTAITTESMSYITTDRSGRYLLGASYGGNSLSVHEVGANGAIQELPCRVIGTPPKAHCVLTDPGNRHVLATSLGGDLLLCFAFDAGHGELSEAEPSAYRTPEGAGPRHLVFHPNGRFVYVACELDGSVRAYDYAPQTGALRPINEVSALPPGFNGEPWVADIHVTPDGRLLYVSERASSTLTAFSIDAESGELGYLHSVPTEPMPRGFNIDPGGHFLLAAGQTSNAITVYEIASSTGRLQPLHRYPTGQNPSWIEIIDFDQPCFNI